MAEAPGGSTGKRRSARKLNRLIFWPLPLLVFLLNGLLSALMLTEWVTVKLFGNAAGYPFGGEGPTPYYYQTADLYAAAALIWGLLLLTTFAFGILAVVKRNRRIALITTGFTILLWFAFFLPASF
jgi:hypothetical protein